MGYGNVAPAPVICCADAANVDAASNSNANIFFIVSPCEKYLQ
jgi:hypothetical protein